MGMITYEIDDIVDATTASRLAEVRRQLIDDLKRLSRKESLTGVETEDLADTVRDLSAVDRMLRYFCTSDLYASYTT